MHLQFLSYFQLHLIFNLLKVFDKFTMKVYYLSLNIYQNKNIFIKTSIE